MGLGRQAEQQGKMYLAWDEIPRSRGHAFYDRLQQILRKSGFDAFAEKLCKPFYSDKGRPSIPPGRYFRMLLVGYFEGIDSERGIEWRCADSLSLRDFLQLSASESVPDHSSLSRTRSRLLLTIHWEVFTWVLKVLSKEGLVLGGRIGVDASTMEANAALRTIVRRDTGENYRQMLARMAKESGIEAPTGEELARMDRKRKGKTLSNKEWEYPVDPEARIAKLKDGRTHLAYKPEHAVDLDTGAVVAVEVHEADKSDTSTLHKTLKAAQESLGRVTPHLHARTTRRN
jgi:transposase